VTEPTKQESASHVWRLMSDYSMTQFRQKSRTLQDIGLTPGHMKALMTLEPGEALPMGVCASGMGCDASTATWLIDRLEEKGLVERRPSPTDRRVKGVVLTETGSQIKASLQEHYFEPPAALLELTEEELRALYSLLSKLAQVQKAADEPAEATV
jgi:DNA-binding MarR family transcriptional regulator